MDSQGQWGEFWHVEGVFTKFQLIKLVPPWPVNDATAIRVDTIESPSWVAWFEIEVFGTAVPTATSATTWGAVKTLFR